MRAAIDFGISNTDVLVETADNQLRHWTQPHRGKQDVGAVIDLLAVGGIEIGALSQLAVTGGQHRLLPDIIDGCPVHRINEIEAIGRGGQALVKEDVRPLLVVSGGSGVAMVAARGAHFVHVTGTGVGGGTLLGLARLLLNTIDPQEIDRLAVHGHANAVDLALSDVVSGPIGDLPVDATAVNFGRVARQAAAYRHEDLAAALTTLVSQVIGTIAINAARGQGIEQIVVTGHLTDMETIRTGLAHVGTFFGLPIQTPLEAGKATAWGALSAARPALKSGGKAQEVDS